jgi:hypothetical protein
MLWCTLNLLASHVQTEDVNVEHALGRSVGTPSGCGKKTRSINKLCAAEPSNGSKKKSSVKKKQKK